MKSLIIKRSILVAGRKTSVSLEDAFWSGLREIAEERGESLSNLVSSINAERKFSNLSSAIRLFVLGFYRDQFNQLDENGSATPAEIFDLKPLEGCTIAPTN
jgi:predicted DNA-binding ribbon-helix-helix protein